jgi:glutamate carboxypeptidase
VDSIRELVEFESPSEDKAAIDRLVEVMAQRLSALGGRVKVHKQKKAGNHVQADFGPAKGPRLLLLGHHDTVYPLGTLATMPCKVVKDRLHGPGVFDMKAGLAFAMEVIAGWNERGGLPRPVTLLSVSDEEVGSESSLHITGALAKKSAAVLVLEPSLGPGGALKTARKGVGEYKLRVKGVSAHAGLEPEKGANAIHELARQILRIASFAEPEHGLTLSADIIRGGSRVNVVAAEAEADIDLRIARMRDAARIEKKMRSLRPMDPRCRLELLGGLNRPPLERTPAGAKLYASARRIAAEMGITLDEAAVGGGSDGNFTAGLGIPTLDGLGAVGEGAHAKHECISISAIPWRCALLASLIERI